MSANTIRLRQLAWYDNDELEIRFPDSWEITTCYMKGHDRPPLSDQSFREAFANPIDTRPIKELARGKKEVVILFDDMARPTRFAQIIPYVLEELEAAGIEDSDILIINIFNILRIP